MSKTPNAADDCRKILDNQHTIVIYRNGMGSYTAAVLDEQTALIVDGIMGDVPNDSPRLTDDFTPSQALYRLTEKFTTGRIA